MKRILIACLLMLSLTLSGCVESCLLHVDADHDGLCDACSINMHDDEDNSTANKPNGSDNNNSSDNNSGNNNSGNNNSGNNNSGNNNSGDNNNPDDPTLPCKAHKDANNDTVCDVCYESVIVIVDIFALNDLHGKIMDNDSQPGLDELTTYLKNKQSTCDNVLLLASGDMWQGSSESNLTRGQIITDWMSEMDFTAMTIGNHDYDWGDSYIADNRAISEFPFLAINVYDKSTGKLADYCTPSIMVDLGYVQIGIIGAVGDVYSSIAYDYRQNVTFKVGSQLTALVKAEATRLREAGADYIIYSIHDGYESSPSSLTQVKDSDISSYYDVSLSAGYVDIVFEAHTHQSYVIVDSKGVYHLQGGGENQGISYAEISINSVTGTYVTDCREIIPSDVYAQYAQDPLVDSLLDKYAEEIAPAYRELGYNSKNRGSTEIKKLIAQLYYEFGIEQWGDEYNLALGGGFLNVRSPYYLYRGTLTYSDVYSVLPFDNQLVLCSIKGYDLYYKFFNTNNSNYYIYYGDYGESIKDSIDFNATYYIITDSYTSTYAYNKLTEIERYPADTFARDLLAEYIENGGFN